MNRKEIEKAFEAIHGNLYCIPDNFCYWRKESIDGRLINKSLGVDYRPLFFFVKDGTLRENLSQLRMVLDYHLSIYYLLKPGLLFGWQHKLVIFQIVGAITEGLLSDYLEFLINSNNNHNLVKLVAQQRIQSKSFGLGSLVEIYKQTKFFKQSNIEILENLRDLRNSVHPKSLNKKTTLKENPLMEKDMKEVVRIFDTLIIFMEKKYKEL